MKIYPRRYVHRTLVSNSDAVLFGFPIPPGGALNKLWFETHIIGPQEQTVVKASLYSMSGWLIPIEDLDDTSTFDTIWDTFVPKDQVEAAAMLDLNQAANTDPELGAGGEIDWHSVFELGKGMSPKRFFYREKVLSAAQRGYGFNSVSAADDTYLPLDFFASRITKPRRTAGAALALMGFSSPVFDQTALPSATQVVPTEKEWAQYRFLNMTLRQALINAIGLTEVGAESPYEEALAFVAKLLEPDAMEDTAAAWQDGSFNVFSRATAEIYVPDDDNIFSKVSGR